MLLFFELAYNSNIFEIFFTVVGELVLVENARGSLSCDVGDEDAVNDDVLRKKKRL